MKLLQAYFLLVFVAVAGYTAVTIGKDDRSLFAVFFDDIAKMDWPGQFNFDFMLLLSLSSIWTGWRNQFTPVGMVLALFALFGGSLFSSVYLLFLTTQVNDVVELLIGQERTAKLKSS